MRSSRLENSSRSLKKSIMPTSTTSKEPRFLLKSWKKRRPDDSNRFWPKSLNKSSDVFIWQNFDRKNNKIKRTQMTMKSSNVSKRPENGGKL